MSDSEIGDKSFPFGCSHSQREFNLRGEVVAIDPASAGPITITSFEKMCQGRALGSKEFKKSILDDELSQKPLLHNHFEGRDLIEANELLWERLLDQCLSALEKAPEDIKADPKSADWKIAIATVLKKQTSVQNTWISQHLSMGVPQAVSRYTAALLAKPKRQQELLSRLTTRITDPLLWET
jgi:hypothetical protein